jgi:hypothetical protein
VFICSREWVAHLLTVNVFEHDLTSVLIQWQDITGGRQAGRQGNTLYDLKPAAESRKHKMKQFVIMF